MTGLIKKATDAFIKHQKVIDRFGKWSPQAKVTWKKYWAIEQKIKKLEKRIGSE